MVRVAEGGGSPEPVTVTDSLRGSMDHVWPEVLPGGRGVVFSVPRSGLANFADWDIAVADLRTGAHTVLMRGVRARYAVSGHLLYVTADGTLMVVPFDEGTLSLTGNPVALAEGLRVGFGGRVDLTISATGTLFYSTGGVLGGVGADLVWVTRDGTAEEVVPGWTEDFLSLQISPDGRRLAVAIQANEEEQIWIRQLDRGPLLKLTFTGWRNARPAWTPDGRNVAFVSSRGDDLDIYARRADGTGPAVLLLDEEDRLGEVSFSPDGEWLVYRVNKNLRDLYARRIGADLRVDSVPVPLVTTEYSESAPAVSPDGRWLAYVSNESGQSEVYVRPFPNTADGKWLVSSDGGEEPVWAHSGRELFYKGNESLMVVEVLPGPTFVTGERRVLFSIEGYRSATVHQLYDVTADDQRFVMVRNRGGSDAGELIVVENFFEELKAKVGN